MNEIVKYRFFMSPVTSSLVVPTGYAMQILNFSRRLHSTSCKYRILDRYIIANILFVTIDHGCIPFVVITTRSFPH